MALSPEQWARINRIYELVKHEGDGECEIAFEDLIEEVRQLDISCGALMRNLKSANDEIESLLERFYAQDD